MELHYGYTKIMGWFYDGPNHTAYIFIDVTENETPRCAYLSHDKLQTVFILNISNLGVESNLIAINSLSLERRVAQTFGGMEWKEELAPCTHSYT